ncbi:NUDIX hydrolase [candidate division TM7 genomosp. GTL1]|nr:NUDIX hydrolase [candidate division TM7 genomosp. GTL1]
MLQKRSLSKSTRPGWYHISAGGHINVGETPVEAAVREVQEEMSLEIDPMKLHYVHSVRIIPRDPRDIVNVFLYRLDGDEEITYLDGEVTLTNGVHWITSKKSPKTLQVTTLFHKGSFILMR